MRSAVLVPLVLAALWLAPGAAAKQICGDVRIDQQLKSDPHGMFGAFDIRRVDVGCATARRIASRYVHDPHAIHYKPKRIEGWACTFRTTDAQEGRVTCKRRAARITFTDVLPSG